MKTNNSIGELNYIFKDNIDDDIWNAFVLQHPNGNIFQTIEMYNVYKNTKKYKPLKLCVTDKDTGNIHGLLSSVTINEYSGILSRFSSRSIVQGGPLIGDNENTNIILPLIMDKYDGELKNKALYSQVRNLFDTNSGLKQIEKYKFEDHLNFIINLDRKEEDVWGDIHKDRRKNINRSMNRGVTIEEVTDRTLIPVFYKLLQETYNNVKIPLADISLIYSAFDILVPKEMATFFLAKYQEKYIGARVVLTYKDMIYDWYAGAANDSLSLYPNEHLVWHILKWGRDRNFKKFDFGGAGKPDVPYGPREFKRRFGGELVNYGWYECVYSPVTAYLILNIFNIYHKFSTARS
jgi:lipid II:glycine glycyltransferase (peptidoglycan interpeptide bridge formation enzyme)